MSLAASACGPDRPGVGGHPESHCVVDRDCAASPAVCEEMICVQGQCVLEPTQAGVSCDDGLFCTVGEACDGNGACSGGSPPCVQLAPGIPKCNESERKCEVCSDGRPMVDGQCRCPFWNCTARGGAAYCAAEDLTVANNVSCAYDGLTL